MFSLQRFGVTPPAHKGLVDHCLNSDRGSFRRHPAPLQVNPSRKNTDLPKKTLTRLLRNPLWT